MNTSRGHKHTPTHLTLNKSLSLNALAAFTQPVQQKASGRQEPHQTQY